MSVLWYITRKMRPIFRLPNSNNTQLYNVLLKRKSSNFYFSQCSTMIEENIIMMMMHFNACQMLDNDLKSLRNKKKLEKLNCRYMYKGKCERKINKITNVLQLSEPIISHQLYEVGKKYIISS